MQFLRGLAVTYHFALSTLRAEQPFPTNWSLTSRLMSLIAEGDMHTLGGGHGARGPARKDGHAETQVGGDL